MKTTDNTTPSLTEAIEHFSRWPNDSTPSTPKRKSRKVKKTLFRRVLEWIQWDEEDEEDEEDFNSVLFAIEAIGFVIILAIFFLAMYFALPEWMVI